MAREGDGVALSNSFRSGKEEREKKEKKVKKDKTKNFQPRGDFVLIKKHDAEEQVTPGGMILPVTAEKMGMTYAEVMAVGPGHYLENGERAVINDLKPGDIVLVAAAQGIPLNAAESRKVMLVNELQVFAVGTK